MDNCSYCGKPFEKDEGKRIEGDFVCFDCARQEKLEEEVKCPECEEYSEEFEEEGVCPHCGFEQEAEEGKEEKEDEEEEKGEA